MAEDIQEEWKELNEEGWCNYIRQEWIIVVQIPLAVIGGILAAVLGGHSFWSFVYWSHAITASVIVALNVFLQLQNVIKNTIRVCWFSLVVVQSKYADLPPLH